MALGTRSQLHRRLGPSMMAELESLRREGSPAARNEGLANLAGRMEQAGASDLAASLYSLLLASPEISVAQGRRFRRGLEAILGQGESAPRIEYWTRHLTREALHPASIFAMGAAGAVFRMTRLAALSRLALSPVGPLQRGLGARILAGGAGFLVEAPTFTLSGMGARTLMGEGPPPPAEWPAALAASYLGLGALRLGGALSQGLANRVGLAPHSVYRPLLHQAGLLGGISLGQITEEAAGLHPHRDRPTRWVDAFATLLQFHAGGRLSQSAFGEGFRHAERSLERRSSVLSLRSDAEGPGWREIWRRAWLAPMWMLMGAGGLGGAGRAPRPRQLSLPFPSQSLVAERQRDLYSENPLTAVAAVQALAELGSRESLPALRALSGDSSRPISVRVAAETARVELGDTSLSPVLRERAGRRGTAEIDRVVAWESLGRLGERGEAVEELRKFFRHFHPPALQRRAALALVRLGAAEAVLSLEHHLERSDPAERADFAAAFFHTERRDRALPLWRGLLEASSSTARRAALELAERFPHREQLEAIRPLLGDPYPELRLRAARTMVALAERFQDGAALEGFLEFTEASSLRGSELVQASAASALLRRGEHPAARERLQDYLHSAFAEVRQQATEGLREGSGDAGNHPSLVGRLGGALGLSGLAVLWWNPAVAEASVGLGQGDAASWWISGLLMTGAAMAVVGSRSSRPPAENPGVGWFEDFYNPAERFRVPPLNESATTIGRSTLRQPNVFGADLRQISRRHLDMRQREGRVEIRVHDRARGARLNGENLLPFEWYRLRDQDLVEFVSESRADILIVPKTGDGSLQPFRLGEKPVEYVEIPAVFRFHQDQATVTPLPPPISERATVEIGKGSRPAPGGEPAASPTPRVPPPSRPGFPLVDWLSGFFQAPARPEPEPPTPAQPPAPRGHREIATEIQRFSDQARSPLGLFDVALQQAHWQIPGAVPAAEARDTLVGLTRAHRALLGAETPWDGRLAQRLDHYEAELRRIEELRGPSSELTQARNELLTVRDRLDRLYEIVRLVRRHFQDPQDLVHFDAIESAYRGLRQELPASNVRVRSQTRNLDTTIDPSHLVAWMEDFRGPTSRAMINARILLGGIRRVHGQPVAGNFHEALSNRTLYSEDRRLVIFNFDAANGAILGFPDAAPQRAEAIMAQHRRSGLRVEEGNLTLESDGSGRIAEVRFQAELRDSVREGLVGLVGLRVLPPLSIQGWTGHAGEGELRSFRLHLSPNLDSPETDWHRVAGLVQNFEAQPGYSLITLEPLHPEVHGGGRQLLIPRLDALHLQVEDVLTLTEVSL